MTERVLGLNIDHCHFIVFLLCSMYLRSLQKEIIELFDLQANKRSAAHRQSVRALHSADTHSPVTASKAQKL